MKKKKKILIIKKKKKNNKDNILLTPPHSYHPIPTPTTPFHPTLPPIPPPHFTPTTPSHSTILSHHPSSLHPLHPTPPYPTPLHPTPLHPTPPHPTTPAPWGKSRRRWRQWGGGNQSEQSHTTKSPPTRDGMGWVEWCWGPELSLRKIATSEPLGRNWVVVVVVWV